MTRRDACVSPEGPNHLASICFPSFPSRGLLRAAQPPTRTRHLASRSSRVSILRTRCACVAFCISDAASSPRLGAWKNGAMRRQPLNSAPSPKIAVSKSEIPRPKTAWFGGDNLGNVNQNVIHIPGRIAIADLQYISADRSMRLFDKRGARSLRSVVRFDSKGSEPLSICFGEELTDGVQRGPFGISIW